MGVRLLAVQVPLPDGQGDWRFDPDEWPDPAGMVAELGDLGVKLMVSIWPTVNPASENYQEMRDLGLLVAAEHGVPVQLSIWDKGPAGQAAVSFYVQPPCPHAVGVVAVPDLPPQVGARPRVRGVRMRARDGAREARQRALPPRARPQGGTAEHRAGIQAAGAPALGDRRRLLPLDEVGNIYPLLHAQGFHDAMRCGGEDEVLSLARSAWAGSQRYGTVIWSGDIGPTFEALRRQIPAGLNIGLSGIPWWTTDIGGFKGGDISSPSFRELIVRWFQFGVFSPICRLHGARQPFRMVDGELTGAANEVWSFGEREYEILRRLLFLRERLRPYVMAQMRIAHESGLPPMRPLFLNHPADQTSWEVEDQFLLGDDLLVAPVTHEGAQQREVYLPAGATWRDAWTGVQCRGGGWVTAPAPLDTIPVYVREGGRAEPFGPFGALGGDTG